MNRDDDFARFARTDELRADLKRKSIRGAAFVAYGGVADLALRLAAIAILARLLLPEDFGLVAMVVALTSVMDGLRDAGLSAATVQRKDISHAQVSNLFWVNATVGLTFTLAFCMLSPLIARFYGDSRLVGITIGLSLVFFWTGLAVQHEALLSRQLRQGELSIVRFVASLLSLVLAIVLALAGWSYWALVLREIARSALLALGVWGLCRWIPGLPQRHVGTRRLIRFGSELSATNLLTGLISNIDKLLIGRMYGAVPVGLYRQAQLLLVAPVDQLNGPIIGVAQSALSALQAEPERYRRYYEEVVFVVGLATIPFGLFVALYAEEVTIFLLGSNWTDATPFVRIFAVAAMLRPVIGTSAVVLITSGHSTRFLMLAVAHSAVLVTFLFVGTHWGPEGVALAHVAATIAMMLPKLHYSFVGTAVSLRGFFVTLSVPLAASAGMAAALIATRQFVPIESPNLNLAVGALVGAAAYFFLLVAPPRGRARLTALITNIRVAFARRRHSAGGAPS